MAPANREHEATNAAADRAKAAEPTTLSPGERAELALGAAGAMVGVGGGAGAVYFGAPITVAGAIVSSLGSSSTLAYIGLGLMAGGALTAVGMAGLAGYLGYRAITGH